MSETETETMRQMRESCESIRDTLTVLSEGASYCPECGRIHPKGEMDCPDCGHVTQDLYDYVHNNLGASITVDAYDTSWLQSVRITFATGGPGIYVDTGDEEVQGRWWGECVNVGLDRKVCDDIEDCFSEGRR